jgi:signal transduction histidine kinase
MNLVALLSFAVIFNNYVNYLNNQISYNIEQYNEVNNEQLCRIANCSYVIYNNNCYIYKRNHLIKDKINSNDSINSNTLKLYNNLYWIDGYSSAIYNNKSKSYYVLNIKNIISDYFLVMEIFIPISLLLFLFPLKNSVKKEQEDALLMIAGNEALLSNKSMINITENIHHELNTPLEVIDNKIEKIHRNIKLYLETVEYEKPRRIDAELSKLGQEFEFIKTSSEQIYAVLEKMKGFKHLRYSNGNKSIRNIIDGGFKIINISNTDFTYSVDNKLSKYKLRILKNADLLSIILNHIKNSLEANADKILILYISHEHQKLKFRIIDNGNGIPKEVMSSVFKPNFSTKEMKNSIRGNGLYLNKHILTSNGGNVEIISTNKSGTTIEITIPVDIKIT